MGREQERADAELARELARGEADATQLADALAEALLGDEDPVVPTIQVHASSSALSLEGDGAADGEHAFHEADLMD